MAVASKGFGKNLIFIYDLSHKSDVAIALKIECVVDTDFEGTLTLPPDTIAALDLPYITRIRANLADDSNVMTRIHLATIIWHGMEREVVVLAMGRRPLLRTTLIVVIDEIL